MTAQAMRRRHFGLDLARAGAIGLVLLAHLDVIVPTRLAPLWGWTGPAGVDLFFALSGLLIGEILLRDTAGRVDVGVLGQFWVRRWLRTIPAYAAMTAIVFVALGQGSALYLIFAQGLSEQALGLFHPTWSLCIEEWFYVLFPLALFALRRGLRQRSAFLAAIVVFLLVPAVLRLGFAWASALPRDAYDFNTALRIDAPAYGLGLAWLRQEAPGLWRRLAGSRALLAAGILLALGSWYAFALMPRADRAVPPVIAATLAETLMPLGAAMVVAWACGWPTWPGGRLWAGAVLWGARLSYGLYLTNLSVFSLCVWIIGEQWPVARIVVAFAGSVVAALALHVAVEKPGMALRARLEPARA